MNILFLGDVTARSGRDAVMRRLPKLKQETSADFTIVNGENAAHGKGITSSIYRQLIEAGADVVTLGNHAFSKSEICSRMEECPYLIRPANLEPKEDGRAWIVRECHGKKIAVVNVLGSIFMDAAAEDPFVTMDSLLEEIEADLIICDFHAEATAEKELFLRVYHDRLAAIIGTHTHVQTADEQIYHGCAYISDAGMCGPFDSILGRDCVEVIDRMVHKQLTKYTPSQAEAMISGVVIEVDESTCRAVSIRRIQERP